MTLAIKTLVSKNKSRYKDGNFNLDLSCKCCCYCNLLYLQILSLICIVLHQIINLDIGKNIIAMGFPASTVEGMYRNHIDDVVTFFHQRHPNHYLIFNLCAEPQRRYDATKFHGFVDTCFTFHDHNPPIFEHLSMFCKKMSAWLETDPENVAAVHCKAGKGRTGVMVCAFLVHAGYCIDLEGNCIPIPGAFQALKYYGDRRTSDGKGVTIQSQRRYIYYYDELVKRQIEYESKQMKLDKVVIINRMWDKGEKNSYRVNCKILQLQSELLEPLLIKYFKPKMRLDKRYHVFDLPRVYVSGDVRVQFSVSSDPSIYRRRLFQLCFNTALVKYSTDIFTLAVERCTTCAKGFELGKVCNSVAVLGTRNQYLDTTKISEMDLNFLYEIFDGEVFCHCQCPLLATNSLFSSEPEVIPEIDEDDEPRSVLSTLSLRRVFGKKKNTKKSDHTHGHQLQGSKLVSDRRASGSSATTPSGLSDPSVSREIKPNNGNGVEKEESSSEPKAKGDDEATETGLSSMASSSSAAVSAISSPKDSEIG